MKNNTADTFIDLSFKNGVLIFKMLKNENNKYKKMLLLHSIFCEKPLQLLADTGSNLNIIKSNSLNKNVIIENLSYAINRMFGS